MTSLIEHLFRLAALTPLMAKMTPNDFIVMVISGFIVLVITILLHFLMDTWSNDQKFIVASILAIVGVLILRRMRDKTRKHRFFYLTVGNVLLGVGLTILIVPFTKWITERIVSHV